MLLNCQRSVAETGRNIGEWAELPHLKLVILASFNKVSSGGHGAKSLRDPAGVPQAAFRLRFDGHAGLVRCA